MPNRVRTHPAEMAAPSIHSYVITESLPLLMLEKGDVVLVEKDSPDPVTRFQVLPAAYAHLMETLVAQGLATRSDDDPASSVPVPAEPQRKDGARARHVTDRSHHLRLLEA